MEPVKVQALVIFKDNSNQKWLKLLTTKEYGHCGILLDTGLRPYEGVELYNWIDSNFTNLTVQPVYSENLGDTLSELFGDATSILKVEIEYPQNKNTLRGIQSCVGIIKHALGLDEWSVWTPQQLRKKLLNKYGAIELLT